MKGLVHAAIVLVLITTLTVSCSDTPQEKPVAAISRDTIPQEETEEEAVPSTVYYRLTSILGKTGMHGAYYEYDLVMRKWCERPMAADMLAYATQNNIEKPEEVPDLSEYFDEQSTNLLNSCIISIKTYPDRRLFSLMFGGETVLEDSMRVSERKIKFKGPFEKFNLDFEGGSMDLTEGHDYEISFDTLPVLVYSNEVGQYELTFRKMELGYSSKKMAKVKSDVTYFHSREDKTTREKAFLVRGQNVITLNVLDGFVESYFTNNKGVVTRGWLLTSDLIMIE